MNANWLNAYATKHEALADFYTQRFRDEFRPAFSARLTSQPREHPQSSPFALPEYRLPLRDESHRLQAESEAAMHEAAHNNNVSDKYVLTTVIFSAAMFLSGITEHVAWKRGGTLLLALGGTLWTEQPLYNQLAFALDRVKSLAAGHPEWQQKEPFKSVLAGDVRAALAGGEPAIVELLAATHAGTTTDEFGAIVNDWIGRARHPVLEAMELLRARQFQVFIVSGGGVEFMRPTAAPGPWVALIVHHTDAEREWAYDRGSAVGRLERGLDEAAGRGWILVDMKRDWRTIYLFQMHP